MLSRVADSLYWMSHYLERAENTARQLDVTMGLMLDTGGVNVEARWQRLLESLGKPAGMEWNGDLNPWPTSSCLTTLSPSPLPSASTAQRKRPPGTRRNFLRAVAEAQPPLPHT